MDTDRFDELTRTLTDVRSRRGALAALVGGSLGLLGLAETAAKKKGKGKGKGKKKKGGGNGSPPPPPPFCQGKPADTPCGADARGTCVCHQPWNGGPPVCDTGRVSGGGLSCGACAPDQTCVLLPNIEFGCYKRCGAA